MPTLEDVLQNKTYKQVGLDVGHRVFHTLTGEDGDPHREKLQAHRNSKAIALLFKNLRENGLLTEAQLDEIMLEVIS